MWLEKGVARSQGGERREGRTGESPGQPGASSSLNESVDGEIEAIAESNLRRGRDECSSRTAGGAAAQDRFWGLIAMSIGASVAG